MEIKIKKEKYLRYLTILQILSSMTNPEIKPFNAMRKRELEVFSILLYYYNEKYASISEAERNRLIFSYDSRVEIAKMLDNLSMDIVYNVMMKLRNLGLITKKNIVKEYIIPKENSFSIKFL
jgi:hypothetical protein